MLLITPLVTPLLLMLRYTPIEIVHATRNKIAEIGRITTDLPIVIPSLDNMPDLPQQW